MLHAVVTLVPQGFVWVDQGFNLTFIHICARLNTSQQSMRVIDGLILKVRDVDKLANACREKKYMLKNAAKQYV